MFCGNDWNQAGTGCSRGSHCPNGASDCPGHQSCWHRVLCDVRDFIPWAEGGRLGKPSHQEIAEEMGLVWPSDDVSAPLRKMVSSPVAFSPVRVAIWKNSRLKCARAPRA